MKTKAGRIQRHRHRFTNPMIIYFFHTHRETPIHNFTKGLYFEHILGSKEDAHV